MSDIVERLEDLRIFIRDNTTYSEVSCRNVVELFASELLADIDDAVTEIERLTLSCRQWEEEVRKLKIYKEAHEAMVKVFGGEVPEEE